MVFDDKMHELIQIIQKDGVILFPTDTVWGLGCSPFSKKAIKKIKRIKGDKEQENFVLLASNIKMLKRYVCQVHPRVETLLDYHTQPLTVVYPKPRNLPEFVVSPDNTIAFRLPHDPFCQTIIELLDHPLISTLPSSILPDNGPNYCDLDPDIIKQVDYACFHKRNIINNTNPSIIISYDKNGEFVFIRN